MKNLLKFFAVITFLLAIVFTVQTNSFNAKTVLNVDQALSEGYHCWHVVYGPSPEKQVGLQGDCFWWDPYEEEWFYEGPMHTCDPGTILCVSSGCGPAQDCWAAWE